MRSSVEVLRNPGRSLDCETRCSHCFVVEEELALTSGSCKFILIVVMSGSAEICDKSPSQFDTVLHGVEALVSLSSVL